MFAPGVLCASTEASSMNIVKLVGADYSVADVESLARLREVIQECIHEYDEESWR